MKKFFTILAMTLTVITVLAKSPLDDLRNAFIRATAATYTTDPDVIRRFIEYSDYGRANDVLLLQLYMSVHLPDHEVERLLSLIDADWSFSDIDYTDQTRGRWQPTLHLTRLYALAKLYADPSSPWYKDANLNKTLHGGIAWWLKARPVCPNWWHNDIGVPKKMTSVLLMLYDELTEDEINGGLQLLERSRFGRTGQNKAWLAGNNLMKGLLIGDEALVIKARDQIAEEIFVTTGEGIQPDWSFHQHGPQIQFGNYGLAYAESLSFWFRVLDGSPYMFTDGQYNILERLLTEGICRSVWQGVMDPSFCGRQVFINGGRGKAYSLAVAALNMSETGRSGSDAFRQMANSYLLPEKYPDHFAGNSYYYRSDCGIVRTPQWYSSIRMQSERTIGFEMTNGENLLANFSADGALLLMQHGREYENIFAYWDWRRIPGTTTWNDGGPIKSTDIEELKRNNSRWVGGVNSTDAMCTTMQLNRDSLHALKTNFFFDDFVVALGCGINTTDPSHISVTTSIDQTHLSGGVTVGRIGATTTFIHESRPELLNCEPGDIRWIHHDNRGYVLFDDSRVVLSTAMQEGKWDYIDPFYKDRTDQGRVFKCYVDHDTTLPGNKYAYALLPVSDPQQTARFAANPPFTILRNDTDCQAVLYNGTICGVFHRPGTLDTGSHSIRVDAPILLISDSRGIHSASPLEEYPHAEVTITNGSEQPRQYFIDFPSDPGSLGRTVTHTHN